MSQRTFKPNFQAIGDAVRLQTAKYVKDNFGISVSLSPISLRAVEASEKWVHPTGVKGFSWEKIKDIHREADRLEIAVWDGARLGGLAIAVTKNSVLDICYIEGDPTLGTPTKGVVAGIIVDCTARYAQRRGRNYLRLQPANPALSELYKATYDFYIHKDDPKPAPGCEPFLRKEV